MAPRSTAAAAAATAAKDKATSRKPVANGRVSKTAASDTKASTTKKTATAAKATTAKGTTTTKAPAKKTTTTKKQPEKESKAKPKASTATATATATKTKTTGRKKAQTSAKDQKENVDPKPSTTKQESESRKRKAVATDEAPSKETKKPRVTKAPAAPKPPKPKVVINERPSQKLNVYVCGEGGSGELGLGSAKNAVDVKRPRLNALLDAEKVGVVQVAAGGMHCVALTHDNHIFTWGVNDQGALGRDTAWEGGYKDIKDDGSEASSDSGSDSGLNPRETVPTAIPSTAFPENTVFVQVAAGDSTSFALTDDGLVYGWGTFRVS